MLTWPLQCTFAYFRLLLDGYWPRASRTAATDREDVDLARLFLQEGRTTIGTAKEFRESGYSLTDAVAIANCAAQELEADRRR